MVRFKDLLNDLPGTDTDVAAALQMIQDFLRQDISVRKADLGKLSRLVFLLKAQIFVFLGASSL